MGTGGDQGLEASTEQKGFPILEQDVGLGQVAFTGTQLLRLPAFQDQAGFEVLFQMIFVACLAVLRNGGRRRFGFFLGVSHRRTIIEHAFRG